MEKKHVTFRSIILVSIFYIFIVFVLKFLWFIAMDSVGEKEVRDGQVVVKTQDFDESMIVNLDGEWDFYPNQLLTPNEIAQHTHEKERIQVPSNWKDRVKGEDAKGVGTYHLEVKVPDKKEDVFGLYFTDLFTSATIYIDGELKQSIGTTSEEKASYFGRTTPSLVNFRRQKDTVDIVIQVSNHELPLYAGILKSVKFGPQEEIGNFVTDYQIMQVVSIVILYLHAMYGVILFFMGQRRRQIVYFILIAISSIVMIGFNYSQIGIGEDVYDISLTSAFKVKIIAQTLITIFVLATFKYFSGTAFNTRCTKAIFIILNSLMGITFILPIDKLLFALTASQFLAVVTFLYIALINWKNRFFQSKYYQLFIFINICLVSGAISNIIFKVSNLTLGFYPFEIVFVLMGLTILLFRQVIDETEEIKRLMNKLKKTNELKNIFISSATTNLQTPIQTIENMSRVMNESGDFTEENNRKIKLIRATSKRMKVTLNNLLDISSMQGEGLRIRKKAVSLQEVVDSIIPIYEMQNLKDVNITSHIRADFPDLYADDSRLTQIISIIMQNTLKYTEKGEIHICATVEKEMANIMIRDTGVGVDQEVIEHILNIHDDIPKTMGETAIGLDLYICNKLIQLHGGDFDIQSTDQEGTTYLLKIPLCTKVDLTHEEYTAQETVDDVERLLSFVDDSETQIDYYQPDEKELNYVKHAKILIVDNDELHAQNLYNILFDRYDVTVVFSAEEAWKQTEKRIYDLMLIEVHMTNMSGLTLTKKIRESFTSYELPIILMSSSNFNAERYSGFAVGANDFMLKPIDAVELGSRVYSFVRMKRSIEEHLQMEAAWLQAQIRPHFLYNTLGTIMSLSYTNQQAMLELLEDFSEYLRMSFKASNMADLIPLEEELQLIYAYLRIEKARFNDRLNVMFNLQEIDDVLIPPLALQTIVENAVRHGILQKSEGGTIFISSEKRNDEVILTVKDNGVGMSAEKVNQILEVTHQGQGIGVYNANTRMLRLFNKPLEIESTEGIGTTIRFYLPIKNYSL